jgi:hypothetical protein
MRNSSGAKGVDDGDRAGGPGNGASSQRGHGGILFDDTKHGTLGAQGPRSEEGERTCSPARRF